MSVYGSTAGQRNGRDAQTFYFQRNDPLEVGVTTPIGGTSNLITTPSADNKYFGGVTYTGGDTNTNECWMILGRKNHVIQIEGSGFSALSVQLQVSVDGVNWRAASGVGPWTAGGIYQFTGMWKFCYITVSGTFTQLAITMESMA